MARTSTQYSHGGEAGDLNLVISMNTPYGKDMYFFDIFINNGRICMGLVADNLENVQIAHIYVVF